MSSPPANPDPDIALDILTRLRQGVPPEPDHVPYIRVARDEEEHRLCDKPTEGLQSVRRGSGQIFFVLGDFGYGKSFFINLLAHRAKEMNMVRSEFDIQDVQDLSNKDELYTKIVQNLRYPDQGGQGLVPLLRKFMDEMNHQELDRIATEHNFVGHPIYQMLDQLLTVQRDGSIYVERDETRLNTRDVLRGVAGYLRGEDIGLPELHAIGKKGFASITKEDEYEYLRHIRSLAVELGYGGIAILIDEAAERLDWNPDSETTQRLIDLYNKCYQSDQFSNMMFVFVGNEEKWESLIEETGHQALEDRYTAKRLVLSELERDDYINLAERVKELVESSEGEDLEVSQEDLEELVDNAIHQWGGVSALSPRRLLLFPNGREEAETLMDLIRNTDW